MKLGARDESIGLLLVQVDPLVVCGLSEVDEGRVAEGDVTKVTAALLGEHEGEGDGWRSRGRRGRGYACSDG